MYSFMSSCIDTCSFIEMLVWTFKSGKGKTVCASEAVSPYLHSSDSSFFSDSVNASYHVGVCPWGLIFEHVFTCTHSLNTSI